MRWAARARPWMYSCVAQHRCRARPCSFYNMGCYHARLGEMDAAVEMLQKAFSKDESLRRSARRDPDLDALRPRLEMI